MNAALMQSAAVWKPELVQGQIREMSEGMNGQRIEATVPRSQEEFLMQLAKGKP